MTWERVQAIANSALSTGGSDRALATAAPGSEPGGWAGASAPNAATTLGPDGGNDALDGGPGDDTIKAGPGNDALDGGANSDDCDGEAGIDSAKRCETVAGVP